MTPKTHKVQHTNIPAIAVPSAPYQRISAVPSAPYQRISAVPSAPYQRISAVPSAPYQWISVVPLSVDISCALCPLSADISCALCPLSVDISCALISGYQLCPYQWISAVPSALISGYQLCPLPLISGYQLCPLPLISGYQLCPLSVDISCAPYQQISAVPSAPYQQISAVPSAPYQWISAVPSAPYQQISAVPSAPYQWISAVPSAPYQQISAVPSAPYQQISAVPSAPYQWISAVPLISRYQLCPLPLISGYQLCPLPLISGYQLCPYQWISAVPSAPYQWISAVPSAPYQWISAVPSAPYQWISAVPLSADISCALCPLSVDISCALCPLSVDISCALCPLSVDISCALISRYQLCPLPLISGYQLCPYQWISAVPSAPYQQISAVPLSADIRCALCPLSVDISCALCPLSADISCALCPLSVDISCALCPLSVDISCALISRYQLCPYQWISAVPLSADISCALCPLSADISCALCPLSADISCALCPLSVDISCALCPLSVDISCALCPYQRIHWPSNTHCQSLLWTLSAPHVYLQSGWLPVSTLNSVSTTCLFAIRMTASLYFELCQHHMFICHQDDCQSLLWTLSAPHVYLPSGWLPVSTLNSVSTTCLFAVRMTASLYFELCQHHMFICHQDDCQSLLWTLSAPHVYLPSGWLPVSTLNSVSTTCLFAIRMTASLYFELCQHHMFICHQDDCQSLLWTLSAPHVYLPSGWLPVSTLNSVSTTCLFAIRMTASLYFELCQHHMFICHQDDCQSLLWTLSAPHVYLPSGWLPVSTLNSVSTTCLFAIRMTASLYFELCQHHMFICNQDDCQSLLWTLSAPHVYLPSGWLPVSTLNSVSTTCLFAIRMTASLYFELCQHHMFICHQDDCQSLLWTLSAPHVYLPSGWLPVSTLNSVSTTCLFAIRMTASLYFELCQHHMFICHQDDCQSLLWTLSAPHVYLQSGWLPVSTLNSVSTTCLFAIRMTASLYFELCQHHMFICHQDDCQSLLWTLSAPHVYLQSGWLPVSTLNSVSTTCLFAIRMTASLYFELCQHHMFICHQDDCQSLLWTLSAPHVYLQSGWLPVSTLNSVSTTCLFAVRMTASLYFELCQHHMFICRQDDCQSLLWTLSAPHVYLPSGWLPVSTLNSVSTTCLFAIRMTASLYFELCQHHMFICHQDDCQSLLWTLSAPHVYLPSGWLPVSTLNSVSTTCLFAIRMTASLYFELCQHHMFICNQDDCQSLLWTLSAPHVYLQSGWLPVSTLNSVSTTCLFAVRMTASLYFELCQHHMFICNQDDCQSLLWTLSAPHVYLPSGWLPVSTLNSVSTTCLFAVRMTASLYFELCQHHMFICHQDDCQSLLWTLSAPHVYLPSGWLPVSTLNSVSTTCLFAIRMTASLYFELCQHHMFICHQDDCQSLLWTLSAPHVYLQSGWLPVSTLNSVSTTCLFAIRMTASLYFELCQHHMFICHQDDCQSLLWTLSAPHVYLPSGWLPVSTLNSVSTTCLFAIRMTASLYFELCQHHMFICHQDDCQSLLWTLSAPHVYLPSGWLPVSTLNSVSTTCLFAIRMTASLYFELCQHHMFICHQDDCQSLLWTLSAPHVYLPSGWLPVSTLNSVSTTCLFAIRMTASLYFELCQHHMFICHQDAQLFLNRWETFVSVWFKPENLTQFRVSSSLSFVFQDVWETRFVVLFVFCVSRCVGDTICSSVCLLCFKMCGGHDLQFCLSFVFQDVWGTRFGTELSQHSCYVAWSLTCTSGAERVNQACLFWTRTHYKAYFKKKNLLAKALLKTLVYMMTWPNYNVMDVVNVVLFGNYFWCHKWIVTWRW